MGSRRYLLRKVLHALATLAFVLAFNFILFRAIGDPVKLLTRTSVHLDPEEQQALREEFGIDDPLPQQFVNYLGDSLRGEFGYSFISGRPVLTVVEEKVWPTVLLVGVATIALDRDRDPDRHQRRMETRERVRHRVPPRLTHALLDAGRLAGDDPVDRLRRIARMVPRRGIESTDRLTGLAHVLDVAKHLVLPCLTLTLGYIGEFAIIMRSSLLEVMGEEFVQTARAKGVRDKDVRRRHAVPNALLPTFTLAFYSVGFILGGAVIVEEVFSWPGLGQLTYAAIEGSDYPVIQAVFLLSSAAVILFNLIADLLYGYLDPRVKEG